MIVIMVLDVFISDTSGTQAYLIGRIGYHMLGGTYHVSIIWRDF
jgi:hypothetical protein